MRGAKTMRWFRGREGPSLSGSKRVAIVEVGEVLNGGGFRERGRAVRRGCRWSES